MKNFIGTYKNLCEFDFLDGPNTVESVKPLPGFIEKGFRTPFKQWQIGHERSKMPGPFAYETGRKQTDLNYAKTEECIHYIVDFLNKNGPFDGFAAFSQGSFMVCCLFKALQYRKIAMRYELPYFLVDFSGGYGKMGTFLWKNRWISPDYFIPGVESIHFWSPNDALVKDFRNIYNFE